MHGCVLGQLVCPTGGVRPVDDESVTSVEAEDECDWPDWWPDVEGELPWEPIALSSGPGPLPPLLLPLVFTSALTTTTRSTATIASITRNQAALRRRSESRPVSGSVSTTVLVPSV